MISRVAESAFWLSLYVERVESLARLLDVNLTFVLDVSIPEASRWHPLVIVLGERERYAEVARASGADLDVEEAVQEFLVWNRASPVSIYSGLRAARENARTIRETISLEMWRALNELWLWMGERSTRRLYDESRHDFYRQIVERCLIFLGAQQSTMLHEEAFEFLRLGTNLERANQTARILDVKYHAIGPTSGRAETSAETAQWLATLRSCSGVEPFFKRSHHVLGGRAVAEFLMTDEAFPRSILHNLERARNFHRLITAGGPPDRGAASAALLDELAERVRELRIEDMGTGGVHEALTSIVDDTARVSSLVQSDFF